MYQQRFVWPHHPHHVKVDPAFDDCAVEPGKREPTFALYLHAFNKV